VHQSANFYRRHSLKKLQNDPSCPAFSFTKNVNGKCIFNPPLAVIPKGKKCPPGFILASDGPFGKGKPLQSQGPYCAWGGKKMGFKNSISLAKYTSTYF
jgi:hypothetical protein